jgi:2-polyprenyl-3-methyl-5-hydroxy-6-metoxy-1,4-benzoquinol methylase
VPSLQKETGRDRYFAAKERELEALLDPETGMLSERYARRIPCPLCASDDHAELFVKRGFTFVRCRECSLVFSNPQVDESLVLEEYRAGGANDLWVDVLTSERQLELDRAKFARILAELEPYRGEGRLLDVGCSIGLFLRLAVDRGWTGQGIEFGERALAYARDRFRLSVTDEPLAQAGFEPESFDAVTLLSVLEHTTAPRQMLREVAHVLRPGGALYVIVPNVESLACRVLHERAATFDGRNHLVYFSPSTLRDTLRREAFEPVSTTTHVSSLDPVLEWLAYEQPYSDADTSGDALVRAVRERRASVERLLEELDLGYKLHCLAIKAPTRRRGPEEA